MTAPNFRRGAPVTSDKPIKDGSWVAKYNGSCGYCGTSLVEGETRVRWNEDRTAVVCSGHRS